MNIPEWMNAGTVGALRTAERRARAKGGDGAGEASIFLVNGLCGIDCVVAWRRNF